MARFAFHLRVRAASIDRYDAAHRRVWPELLRVLKEAGIRHYSIFRAGQDLFFYMEADDFNRAWDEIEKSSANQRWQEEMAAFFEPMSDRHPGDRFPMMREVFYLE